VVSLRSTTGDRDFDAFGIGKRKKRKRNLISASLTPPGAISTKLLEPIVSSLMRAAAREIHSVQGSALVLCEEPPANSGK